MKQGATGRDKLKGLGVGAVFDTLNPLSQGLGGVGGVDGYGLLGQDRPRIKLLLQHGSYSIKDEKFQKIPGWIELNFQDISDVVYRTNVAINMVLSIYFAYPN